MLYVLSFMMYSESTSGIETASALSKNFLHHPSDGHDLESVLRSCQDNMSILNLKSAELY